MKVGLLPSQMNYANRANTFAEVSHEDLTEETNDTDQTLTLFTAKAGQSVRFVKSILEQALKDASDSALNDTKVSIGISGNTDLFLAATQVNENGTEVLNQPGALHTMDLTAATVATADGSDAGTTQTLANALKAEVNKIITDLGNMLLDSPYHVFAADTDIIMTVESMAGKALNDIDTGRLVAYFDVQ